MKRTEKRYYKLGEKVFVKETKEIGVITDLTIDPANSIFKATVEVTKQDGDATIITKRVYDLWEIDKNKRTMFKDKHKSAKPTILFAKVRETATIPSKIQENAGYDIYANFEEDYVIINSGEVVAIPTGIASSVSDDWALIVKERGSTGSKAMAVRAGVVDSGYRGEIFVMLNNTSNHTVVIAKKDVEVVGSEGTVVYPYDKAIAQLLLVQVPKANVQEISFMELQAIPSNRGEGKIGSSGK